MSPPPKLPPRPPPRAPKAPQAAAPEPEPSAPSGLSDDDLLDGGLDALQPAYFTSGFTGADGVALPEMLTLHAARLAKAWSRLDVAPRDVLDLVVLIDAELADPFEAAGGTMAAVLPLPLKQRLLGLPEAEPERFAHPALREWFAKIAPVLARFRDASACVAHLIATVRYMGLERGLQAQRSPFSLPAGAPASAATAHARFVLANDAVLHLFKEEDWPTPVTSRLRSEDVNEF